MFVVAALWEILGAAHDRHEKALKIGAQLRRQSWRASGAITRVTVVATPEAELTLMAGDGEDQHSAACPTPGLPSVARFSILKRGVSGLPGLNESRRGWMLFSAVEKANPMVGHHLVKFTHSPRIADKPGLRMLAMLDTIGDHFTTRARQLSCEPSWKAHIPNRRFQTFAKRSPPGLIKRGIRVGCFQKFERVGI